MRWSQIIIIIVKLDYEKAFFEGLALYLSSIFITNIIIIIIISITISVQIWIKELFGLCHRYPLISITLYIIPLINWYNTNWYNTNWYSINWYDWFNQLLSPISSIIITGQYGSHTYVQHNKLCISFKCEQVNLNSLLFGTPPLISKNEDFTKIGGVE